MAINTTQNVKKWNILSHEQKLNVLNQERKYNTLKDKDILEIDGKKFYVLISQDRLEIIDTTLRQQNISELLGVKIIRKSEGL